MNIFYKAILLITTLTLLSACTETEQHAMISDPFEDLPILELSTPLNISDHDSISNGRFFFQSKYFRDMAISKEGDIFVSNARGNSIQQFDEEGNFITNIGTEGRGPGEFRAAPVLDILKKDTLFTLSHNAWMVNVFVNADGEWFFSNSFTIPQRNNANPQEFYQLTDNELAFLFEPAFQLLIDDNPNTELYKILDIISTDGESVADSILSASINQKLVFRSDAGATLIQEVPYGSKSVINPGPDGSLYHLTTDNFLIEIYNKTGSLKDSIKHSNFSVEITEDQRRSKIEEKVTASTGSEREDRVMKENMFEQVPSKTHPLNDMFVDRDTGFIIVKRSEIYDDPNWLLLNPDGKRLGVFNLSESLEVFDFRKGKIVGAFMSDDPEILPTVRVLSFPKDIF